MKVIRVLVYECSSDMEPKMRRDLQMRGVKGMRIAHPSFDGAGDVTITERFVDEDGVRQWLGEKTVGIQDLLAGAATAAKPLDGRFGPQKRDPAQAVEAIDHGVE